MSTPIYDLTEWAAAQSAPWVPHNVALRALEAACRAMVLDRDLSAPPGSCDDGDTFLIAGSPTGAWSGHGGTMAVAMGANASNGWIFLTVATPGQVLWVSDETARIRWSGSSWETLAEPIQERQFKEAVRVATVSAGALATDFENGDTIDGVVLVTGNRILIKDQAAPAENGLYIVAASGPPARSPDADSDLELAGAVVFVLEGSANAGTQWTCAAVLPLTVGVDPLPFVLTGGLPSGAVPQTRQITATGALSGGGDLEDDIEIGLDPIEDDPSGIYTNPNISVDEYGRVVAAENGSGGIPEAPDDGAYYARRNEDWTAFTPGEGGSSAYDFGFVFEATPESDDVLGRVRIGRDITIPINFGGASGGGDTNPVGDFEIDVQDDGVSIGTITVAAAGTITWATDGGTAKDVAAGSEILFLAPATSPADGSIAGWSFVILATQA